MRLLGLLIFCFSDLVDLVNELEPVSAKWRWLGVNFGFTVNDLDGIQMSNAHGGVMDWMTTMLDKKLNNIPGFRWEDVIKALEKIGHGALAEQIKRTHCPPGLLYTPTCTCTLYIYICMCTLLREYGCFA